MRILHIIISPFAACKLYHIAFGLRSRVYLDNDIVDYTDK